MQQNKNNKQQLQELAEQLTNTSIQDLYKANSERFSQSFEGIHFDFRKQFLDEKSFKALISLGYERKLDAAISALLTGEQVNPTEKRSALHSALREPKTSGHAPETMRDQVHAELENMARVISEISSGSWTGVTGKVFTDIVFLGVGGSNLGPDFVLSALHEFDSAAPHIPAVHFVSCMDGIQLMRVLSRLDAETSMMVICSKSFSTKDTLLNAETMLEWFAAQMGSRSVALNTHVLAISANHERMSNFGIPENRQLLIWDWVGGRFSLWSAVGFPVALRLGMQGFTELLAGGHSVDLHFSSAPLEQNIPVLMGLLSYWNTSILNRHRNMILAYDARLDLLADYLAQLHMESLGKQTDLHLQPVKQNTGSMLWGGIGTNSQHSYYQLLHQGTQAFYADFILVREEPDYSAYSDEVTAAFRSQYRYAHANCYAQSDLFAFGQDNTDPNRRYHGNHPSVLLSLESLTPYSLGQLIALYEHRTYVNAVLLNINAFDQFGVEQGKVMAEDYFRKM